MQKPKLKLETGPYTETGKKAYCVDIIDQDGGYVFVGSGRSMSAAYRSAAINLRKMAREADKMAKLHRKTNRRIAPWTDFKGRAIHEGDRIIHPASGEKGTVIFDGGYRWLVKYDDDFMSNLCLQIGDKGMAEVMT